MPDELWNEVHDIVQDTGIKNIPKKNKCKKKAKWLLEEELQIALKRREVKSKGEKERYKHLNAEFQRGVKAEDTWRRPHRVLAQLLCWWVYLIKD